MMKSGRTVLVALTLTGALAVATGCTPTITGSVSVKDGSIATPSGTGDPQVVLTASITKSQATSCRYTFSSQMGQVSAEGTGVVDVAAHSESATITLTAADRSVHEQITLLGTDMYLKMDTPIRDSDASKWIHLDLAKLRSLATIGLNDPWDPTNVSAYGKDVVTVQQSSPGHFQGTIDITKVPLPSMSSAVSMFGDALKAIPFQAIIDDQGRLTSFTVNMPALGAIVPASTSTMTFSDFGAPVHVQAPPASQTQDAPDALYQAFSG